MILMSVDARFLGLFCRITEMRLRLHESVVLTYILADNKNVEKNSAWANNSKDEFYKAKSRRSSQQQAITIELR